MPSGNVAGRDVGRAHILYLTREPFPFEVDSLMLTFRHPFLIAALFLPAVLLSSLPAEAIPAFARRYQTSCSTCHVHYPRLNAVGDAFRRRGYQFARDDLMQHSPPPITLVAEGHREMWPASDWPADLAPVPAISLVVFGGVPVYPDDEVRPEGEAVVSFDRLFRGASLVGAARLGDNVALYASVSLAPKETAGVGRGFVVISDLAFGPALTLRIGQMEPQVASFSSTRRSGGPVYRLLSDAPPSVRWALEPLFRGLTVSGIFGGGAFAGRFGYDVGYGQGLLTSSLGEPLRQIPRDGYAHLHTKLGGLRLDGVEEPTAAGKETSLMLGAFAYSGRHRLDRRVKMGDPKFEEDARFFKAGLDADARLGAVEVIVAFAVERHELDTQADLARQQGLAEVSYAVFPWLTATTRVEADFGLGYPRRRLLPILTVTPRMNLKTSVYATIEEDGSLDDAVHLSEVNLGASCAF